tara:strand:- start:4285 stop:5031 length:747 start_codon:yes stop_codon:yes gene_type:complete
MSLGRSACFEGRFRNGWQVMKTSELVDLLKNRSVPVKLAGVGILILAAVLGLDLDEAASDGDVEAGKEAGLIQVSGKKGEYERLSGCVLVEHRNNDGDSFFVRHQGREFELRLYFVDTAEKYLSDRHESQRERVRDQAGDFGLTVEQTVALGNESKNVVLELLRRTPFTVYTKWDRVYDGERFHGFVELDSGAGSSVYLSQLLVDKGLARIHTHGEPTPDGRGWREYKDFLRSREAAAKQKKVGAWGK